MLKKENENQHHPLFGYGCKIQCLGNREMMVEGNKGILQYQENEIRLNLGNGQLSIKGENLNIPSLERNFVQIQGRILEIEFI